VEAAIDVEIQAMMKRGESALAAAIIKTSQEKLAN
jgi:hypothetical protein